MPPSVPLEVEVASTPGKPGPPRPPFPPFPPVPPSPPLALNCKMMSMEEEYEEMSSLGCWRRGLPETIVEWTTSLLKSWEVLDEMEGV